MTNLLKRAATALIAAPLFFGAVPVSTFATAPASAATVLAPHGAWRGISSEAGFGVMTEMVDGGTAAIVATTQNDTVSLVLTDPKWNWKIGQTSPVNVRIDGELFTGEAVVSERDTVKVSGLTLKVVRRFARASQMVVNIGNGSIVWTIGLMGFTASMGDAVRTYKTSY